MKPIYIIVILLLLALAAWYFLMPKASTTAAPAQSIANLPQKQQEIAQTIATQPNLVSVGSTEYTGGAMSSSLSAPSIKKTVSIP